MSTALDRFETALVAASRTLHEGDGAAEAANGGRGESHAPTGPPALRPRRRLRRRGLRAIGAVCVVAVLAAAGTAVLGPTGNPRYITQFECGVSANGNTHGLFTSNPVAACAALWPSIYHRPAPPLAAWVYETGGVVVVRPVDQPPAGGGWKRLPKGWTAASATIELNDQLEDITTGLPARPCWSATGASALVTSILRSDGLGYWHVRVSTQRPSAGVSASASCLSVMQAIGGPELAPDTVLLVEHATQPPPGSPRYPSRFGRQRRLLEAHVNQALRADGRCASAAQAAATWRSYVRTSGIPAAEDVLGAPLTGAGTRTRCARILISEPGGGGPANVYAAEVP